MNFGGLTPRAPVSQPKTRRQTTAKPRAPSPEMDVEELLSDSGELEDAEWLPGKAGKAKKNLMGVRSSCIDPVCVRESLAVPKGWVWSCELWGLCCSQSARNGLFGCLGRFGIFPQTQQRLSAVSNTLLDGFSLSKSPSSHILSCCHA